MYAAAARVKELDYYTRLGREFKSHLEWWHTFLVGCNGLSLLRSVSHATPADFVIQTDASGTWGCGAFFNKVWFQWRWPPNWAPMSIMAKELVPILLSCVVWGSILAKHRALFQCDNLSPVDAIRKGSSKDKVVMHLLRCLWFFTAYFDIELNVEHIAGALIALLIICLEIRCNSSFYYTRRCLYYQCPSHPNCYKWWCCQIWTGHPQASAGYSNIL